MAQGKEHIPTDESRALVEKLSGVGLNHDGICAMIDLSDRNTLVKHYDVELRRGKAVANAKIGGKLFNDAMEGNTTAQIWWTKAQGGWKETNVTEHAGSLAITEIRNTIVDPK